jgi:hypothetical protein
VVDARLGHSWHPLANATLVGAYVPTDGSRAANVGTGDFGTSPIFVQLSDKPLLVSTLLVGVSERKAQWRIEK